MASDHCALPKASGEPRQEFGHFDLADAGDKKICRILLNFASAFVFGFCR